jgi:outer membrane lipase/esterase
MKFSNLRQFGFRLFSLASSFIISVAISANQGSAATISSLVVFGDSLSDNGNAAYIFTNFPQFVPKDLPAPAPPLYTEGRYTNGPDVTPGTAFRGTWVEQFAAKLGLADPTPGLPNFLNQNLPAGNNLAVAGANTNDGSPVSIDAMVNAYVQSQGGSVSGTPLYILFGGANDVFRAQDPVAAAQAAVTNIFADVALLHAAGAQNFLVPNLPDLGTTPRALQSGTGGALSAASTEYASDWATALAKANATGENVTGVDLFDLYKAIEADAAAYGLSNINTPAQGQNVNPDQYLFWDIIHPTTAGHSLIADAAYNAVTNVPEPATFPVLAVGIVGIVIGARRKSGRPKQT